MFMGYNYVTAITRGYHTPRRRPGGVGVTDGFVETLCQRLASQVGAARLETIGKPWENDGKTVENP